MADFSTVRKPLVSKHPKDLRKALQSAYACVKHSMTRPKAAEMDFVQAMDSSHKKLLILLSEGDSLGGIWNHVDVDDVDDDASAGRNQLSQDGVWDLLALSRRATMFCTEENGLLPELVLAAPRASSIRSCAIALPYTMPAFSNLPWICHESLMNPREPSDTPDQLHEFFPNVRVEKADCDEATVEDGPFDQQQEQQPSKLAAQFMMLQNTERFLDFLSTRDERIIVVSSQAWFLWTFLNYGLDCKLLQREPDFYDADIRIVGLDL